VKKHLSFPEIAWERTAGVAPPRACDRREAAPRTQRVTRQSLGTRLRQRLRKGFMLWLALSTLAGCGQSSGDRVLVDKNLYETGLARPARFDVVVFKYPRGPVENGTPKNYIKRLLGLPGQILAIFFGQLYFWEPGPGEPPPYDDINNPKVKRQDLWQESFMHIDDEKSQGLFNTAGKFQIIRKPPAVSWRCGALCTTTTTRLRTSRESCHRAGIPGPVVRGLPRASTANSAIRGPRGKISTGFVISTFFAQMNGPCCRRKASSPA